MLYGMYISAAGALANSYRQDVVANNLANVETVAFKPDLALFQARRTQAHTNGQREHTTVMLEGIGGGIFALPTSTDFSPASLSQTDGRFDLAIAEKGFFQVQKGSQLCYTRDGRFTHDHNNQLVTVSGRLPVLDDKGGAITVNPGIDNFNVDEAGLITQNETVIARLGIVDFDDTRVLRKEGRNLYSAPAQSRPRAVQATVKQGYIENSGVNALEQLAEMIKTQRLFQANITMMQIQDHTLGLAASRLGSVT